MTGYSPLASISLRIYRQRIVYIRCRSVTGKRCVTFRTRCRCLRRWRVIVTKNIVETKFSNILRDMTRRSSNAKLSAFVVAPIRNRLLIVITYNTYNCLTIKQYTRLVSKISSESGVLWFFGRSSASGWGLQGVKIWMFNIHKWISWTITEFNVCD